MKQAFNNFLKKFEVNGYNPLSMFNIILALLSLIGGILVGALFSHYGVQGALATLHNNGSDKYFLIFGLIATPICFIVLIIRNLKIKSIPKFILYTILQYVSAVIVTIIYIIVFLFGMLLGGSSTTTSNTTRKYGADEGSYSDLQNQQARAQGYSNGKEAEMSGRSWNGNNWV